MSRMFTVSEGTVKCVLNFQNHIFEFQRFGFLEHDDEYCDVEHLVTQASGRDDDAILMHRIKCVLTAAFSRTTSKSDAPVYLYLWRHDVEVFIACILTSRRRCSHLSASRESRVV